MVSKKRRRITRLFPSNSGVVARFIVYNCSILITARVLCSCFQDDSKFNSNGSGYGQENVDEGYKLGERIILTDSIVTGIHLNKANKMLYSGKAGCVGSSSNTGYDLILHMHPCKITMLQYIFTDGGLSVGRLFV